MVKKGAAGCPFHGVLIVDKPKGPTSHDVVQWVRRAVGCRAVGHAGTLDPMATGVLVLAVGEGTKLVSYLTAQDKEYEASIALGAETDTLDAEGAVTHRCPVPDSLTVEEVREASRTFLGTIKQIPPAVSAIKVDGQPLHVRVRRGEKVTPLEREVTVSSIEVRGATPQSIQLNVACGKGFYVRSLARDLSRALGTCGHLEGLRRTRSGPFTVEGALTAAVLRMASAGDSEARQTLLSRAMSLSEAWSGARAVLSPEGVGHAYQGRPVPATAMRPLESPGARHPLERGSLVALLDAEGTMIAIASSTDDGSYQVVRGFRTS